MAEKKESTWDVIQKHMMSGIGYMIPLIIGYTLIKGIGQTIGMALGIDVGSETLLSDSNMLYAFLAWIEQVAAPTAQALMYPVFAGYLAYSVGKRPALMPAFIGGAVAQAGGSGFIGALSIGFATGYFMKWITRVWKVDRKYQTVMTFTAYPSVGTLFVFVLMYFIINPAGSAITNFLVDTISGLGAYGAIPYAAAIGGMMAFDCGGPVNKAAFTISVTLMGTGVNMAPLYIGSELAPLGLGFAWLVDKLAFKGTTLPEELEENGLPALIMGALGVTEGALPGVLFDPLAMIPINVTGTVAASIAAELFGIHFENFIGFGVLCGKPLEYLLSLLIGMSIVAALTLVRMKHLKSKAAKAETIEE